MGGWQVIRKLGEGGSGEVYHVRTPEGEEAALKVLTAAHRHQRPLFEREASLLIRLRHPSIASVHGYLAESLPVFGEDRGPCFWMDLVSGDDVATASREVADDRKIQWMAQALEALRYLHGQGVLHGDLSPGNLRIGADGRLKLLDFGFAGSLAMGSALGAKPNGAPKAGTILYLAPERLSGAHLAASDLFSLGTLFYEILAGEHPRASCRSLREILTKAARPLLEVAPQLKANHAVVARVIDRMIRVSVAERFASAQEVLEALRGGEPQTQTESSPYYPMAMTGADEAFENISSAIASLNQGSSALFFVHGVTGTGKSRFLRETAFQCALAGVVVREIVPENLSSWKTMPTSPPATPEVWVFRSLEKASFSDLTVLVSARRDRIPARVMGVFEWNDDHLSADSRRVLEGMPLASAAQDIVLLNLSEEQVRDFLTGAVGGKAAENLAQVAFEKTGGNPLLLLELVQAVRGAKEDSRKKRIQDLRGLSDGVHSMMEILEERLSDLPSEDREILLLLATARVPTGLEELLRVGAWIFKVPPDEAAIHLLPRLEFLSSLGLIRTEEGAYRLAFPDLEPAVLNAFESSQIRLVHDAWLEALKAEPDHHLQKIQHAIALERKDIVRDGALAAAEALQSGEKPEEALRLIAHAIPILVEYPADVSRLLRMRVNLMNAQGRFREALQNLEEVFALQAGDEPAEVKTVKYWLISGQIFEHLGEEAEAARRWARCLSEAEAHPGGDVLPYVVKAHSVLGQHELRQGRLGRAREHFEKGLSLNRTEDRRRAEICRSMARVAARESQWEKAAELLEEAKRMYRAEGFRSGEIAACIEEGNLAVDRGDVAAAETAYREAEAVARAGNDDLFLALVWHNQGVLARKQGRLAAALDLLEKSLEILRPLGNFSELADGLLEHAVTEAEVGHFAKAEIEIEAIRKLRGSDPRAQDKANEAEAILREYRDGTTVAAPNGKSHPDWDVEYALRRRAREAQDAVFIRNKLNEIYDSLPPGLQVSFVDRADYKQWVLANRGG